MKFHVNGTIVQAKETNNGGLRAVLVTDYAEVINIFTKKEEVKNKIVSVLGTPSLFAVNINFEGTPAAFDFDILNF